MRKKSARSSAPGVHGERGSAPAACPNCGARLGGPYCAQCGERAPSPHDYELSSLGHDAVHSFFHFDGKLLRSLRALYTKPGFLTQEYFAGRRGRYAKPIALFIALNLVFFLFQPYTGLLSYRFDHYVETKVNPATGTTNARNRMIEARIVETGESREVYRARFDTVMQGQKKSYFVVVVPIFAAVLALLRIGSKRRYVEHLVFSVHFFAVYLTMMLAIVFVLGPLVIKPAVLAAVRAGLPPESVQWLFGEPGLIVLLLMTLGTYLYLALRRFYGLSRTRALVEMLVLFVVQNAVMFVFRLVLFWTAYFAT